MAIIHQRFASRLLLLFGFRHASAQLYAFTLFSQKLRADPQFIATRFAGKDPRVGGMHKVFLTRSALGL